MVINSGEKQREVNRNGAMQKHSRKNGSMAELYRDVQK